VGSASPGGSSSSSSSSSSSGIDKQQQAVFEKTHSISAQGLSQSSWKKPHVHEHIVGEEQVVVHTTGAAQVTLHLLTSFLSAARQSLLCHPNLVVKQGTRAPHVNEHLRAVYS
jgi:hypothetical protein